jgi:hypothetical protein
LWQDTSSVPEYTAPFKQLMARTGYSSGDLRDRFYEHLTTRIKDELVHTARPISTLDDLITVASDINVRVRQHRAKRDREKKCVGTSTGITTSRTPLPNPPFAAPASDPNAMDVDATHTREEFMRKMRGKCFGCGSSLHTKKDSNQDRDLCSYCKHVGHREVVCMDKFTGRPKSQKAAATGEGGSMEIDTPGETSKGSEKTETIATTAATLTQLLEQQKILANQIATLRKEDF